MTEILWAEGILAVFVVACVALLGLIAGFIFEGF